MAGQTDNQPSAIKNSLLPARTTSAVLSCLQQPSDLK